MELQEESAGPDKHPLSDSEIKLVGAVDIKAAGGKLKLATGSSVPFSADLEQILTATQPEVMVDFTLAPATMPAVRIATRR